MDLTAATAEASLADMRELRKLGMAIAAMIKIIATTIRSSMSENPVCLFLIRGHQPAIVLPRMTSLNLFTLIEQHFVGQIPVSRQVQPLYNQWDTRIKHFPRDRLLSLSTKNAPPNWMLDTKWRFCVPFTSTLNVTDSDWRGTARVEMKKHGTHAPCSSILAADR